MSERREFPLPTVEHLEDGWLLVRFKPEYFGFEPPAGRPDLSIPCFLLDEDYKTPEQRRQFEELAGKAIAKILQKLASSS